MNELSNDDIQDTFDFMEELGIFLLKTSEKYDAETQVSLLLFATIKSLILITKGDKKLIMENIETTIDIALAEKIQ